MRPGQSEARAVMVERRIQPRSRVVALPAALREIGRYVIRICRPLVILQVAGNAGRAGQVVIVIDVAITTLPWRHGMHAGQGKSGQRVIKRRIRPRDCVVALVACLGKRRRYVVRIGGCLVILQVTGDASCTG